MTTFAFLVQCCRGHWGVESSILSQPDDWMAVLNLAQRQGLLPLVYHHLKQSLWSELPTEMQAKFTTAVHRQIRQNFQLVATLCQLLQDFQWADIPVLPFKGPILTEAVYGNITLRRIRDLDLLIYPQDIQRTHDWLWTQGYQCCDRLTPAQLQQRFRANYENALIHPETGVQIDLHWGIVPRYYACQLTTHELYDRAIQTHFHQIPCLTLSPEDRLLMLCFNGLKDGWFELQRLGDVAACVQHYPDLDWPSLWQMAKAQDGDRALLLGLALTQTILGIALPDDITQQIASDRRVQQVRDRLITRLYTQDDQDWNLWTQTLLPLQLQRRWSSQLYSLQQLVLPINERDLGDWVLPRSLFWLYYPWRLVRLPWKYLRLLWQLSWRSPNT